jgi:polar amino acid transport system substrate-binding protein
MIKFYLYKYQVWLCRLVKKGTTKVKTKNRKESNMFNKLIKSLFAFLIFLSLTLTAQARSLDEIMKSGVLKMGVNPGLPPLAKYNEKNELVGFDADIGAKLAEMLGVELELVKVGSPDRIPFVATGKIDIVMGALTRNYKRQKIVDYTVPVHTEVFGALTTSKKPFADVMDMNSADVKLAQVRGSMPAGWAQKNLPNAKITLFDNYPDAMRSIAQGRADAIVDVVDFLGEHMNKHKNVEWQVVDKAIDTWYCGIGVKKGNSSLQQWLNVALYTLHRADFVDQTWEKWFGIRQIHSVEPQPYF